MIVAILVSLGLLPFVFVGSRALDNATRLYDLVWTRIGFVPERKKRSRLAVYAANIFTALVSAPITGIFILARPRHRRAWLALIAVGMVKQAHREGRVCEHKLLEFDRVLTSWTFLFGAELPAGRFPPEPDDE